eukprot:TRINITY_DN3115_c3_g1_i1.p1 TRINITY_DN3115_c3_g1~~TRINITY_DN3115_c3_g1_i1.p1  ORF type:complete len:824 (-),score=227.06 TRINITY_DN3115_c3_g1_i1:150-2543(-)
MSAGSGDGAAEPPKADGAAPEERMPGRIVQLEETVINRIAAGEVVVRPANALKELMENCIDAGSTRVNVSVKAGGLKMMRIEDDGHGIRKDDLPILCERFTTSKLKSYEDLNSIGTFGFRGEALASISHVAHLSVTTMTKADSNATVAHYSDGKLKGPPKASAGRVGTTLIVEDMFYNNPTRRQALSKDTVEHSKLLEVMQKYAIHYPRVSFSCRKAANAAVAELMTQGGASASSLDVIGNIYGNSIAKELFPFEVSCEDPRFQCRGYASSPNWSARNGSMTFFINHRLVDCSPLKRAIEAVYAPLLPRHQHPWMYVELEVDPATIDVNVHPTKSEVQFLNEEVIGQKLQETLAEELRKRGGAKTFGGVQMPLVGSGPSKPPASEAKDGSAAGAVVSRIDVDAPKRVDLNPTRVRTDHLQRSLASVLRDNKAAQQQQQQPQPPKAATGGALAGAAAASGSASWPMQLVPTGDAADDAGALAAAAGKEDEEEQRRAVYEEAQRLTSVCELRTATATVADAKLTKSLQQSVFVGPVSRELALLQCGKALCMVNLARAARECAEQRLLRQFGAVSPLVLKEPLPLREVVRLGILDPDSGYDPDAHKDVDVEALGQKLTSLLLEKAEMLNEYISLDIQDDGKEGGPKLLALPNALGVTSDSGLTFDCLPLFLVRLCADVNWKEEKACFSSLVKVVADSCVEMLLPTEEEAEAADVTQKRASAAEANAAVASGEFEDVAAAAMAASKKRARTAGPNPLEGLRWLHEAIRRDGACQWPGVYSTDGTVLELASLDQLYRIFERC